MFLEHYDESGLVRYCFYGTTLIFVASLFSFLWFTIYGFSSGDELYRFYTPFTPSMISLTFTVTSFLFLLWLFLYPTTLTKRGCLLWLLVGMLYCCIGFMAMVAFATLPDDANSAAVCLFWLLGGASIALMTFVMRAKGPPDSPKKKCCTARNTCNCISFGVVLFFAAFSMAIMIQSISSSLDVKTYPAPGTIYSLNMDGKTIELHLNCYGTKSNATWIFEHGGGSNSLSMRALADGVSNAGNRVCVYDRLGYGWSPSYVTIAEKSQFSNSSYVLLQFLNLAGETGPYKCVGHSAGAAKCLEFALTSGNVNGLAYIDGYPDYVTAGGSGAPPLAIIGIVAYFAAATGFTRGLVGKSPPTFVPSDAARASTALYAQNRFWYSQYWDVKSAPFVGDGTLYTKLNGTKVNGLFYKYGNTLNASIGVFPAWSTTTILNCSISKYQSYDCCKGENPSTAYCTTEKQNYLTQAQLYANSTCINPGIIAIAPESSEHSYLYSSEYISWITNQVLNALS